MYNTLGFCCIALSRQAYAMATKNQPAAACGNAYNEEAPSATAWN